MIDIPCKGCGHGQNEHCPIKYSGTHHCGTTECNVPNSLGLLCACMQFIPDNLLFIEQVAKERKLI
jgi:hypothetical protein